MEAAGQRMSELRHRVQLDEKIEKLDLAKNDLEQQAIELMEHQFFRRGCCWRSAVCSCWEWC